MTYDPAANPRHLSPVSEEAEQKHLQRIEQLEQALEALRRKVGMFNSKGWGAVRNDLYEQLQIAVNYLASDKPQTLEAYAFVKGQIRAYQTLIGMSEVAVETYKQIQQELEQARAVLDE